eukprot:gene3758-13818_t
MPPALPRSSHASISASNACSSSYSSVFFLLGAASPVVNDGIAISTSNASSSSSPCVLFLGATMPVGTDGIAISASNASSSSSSCVFLLGATMPVDTDAHGTWVMGTGRAAASRSSSSSVSTALKATTLPPHAAISASDASSSCSPCAIFLGAATPVGSDVTGACGTWVVGTGAGASRSSSGQITTASNASSYS